MKHWRTSKTGGLFSSLLRRSLLIAEQLTRTRMHPLSNIGGPKPEAGKTETFPLISTALYIASSTMNLKTITLKPLPGVDLPNFFTEAKFMSNSATVHC